MFDVILADPPWPYYGDPNKMAAAGKHYDLMTYEELWKMSEAVMKVRNPKSVLYMWSSASQLERAIALCRAWGFHYRGMGFVWVKTTKDGEIISGQGVRPTTVKPTTEFVIVGTTTRTGRPIPVVDEGVGQVVLDSRGPHSAKPEEVMRRIERVHGDVPRLELFARTETPGWTCTGLELTGHDYRKGVIV